MKNRVYLDYNATTPMRPAVMDTMIQVFAQPHNASSVHSYGREGRKWIETARERVAQACGAPQAQILFNSGATESNNTVLHHFAGERLLVSAIEHPSVLEAMPHYTENFGIVPVTPDGVLDLTALEEALKKTRTTLVSVMAVNNETGVIQPVREIADLAHQYGALYHCDAAQALGKIPLDITEWGVDFLTLSAHKIGGPQGVGALVLGLCGKTPTLLHGGGQEKRARAGTENVSGVAGFGVAVHSAQETLTSSRETFSLFQKRLEEALRSCDPDIVIHGLSAPRVPHTISFSVAGLSSETLLMALDLEGIAVSNGSACSSGRVTTSHVLKAMQVPDSHAQGALRLSMGWATTHEDCDRFLAVWTALYKRLKS